MISANEAGKREGKRRGLHRLQQEYAERPEEVIEKA
jgi:hypothetical protein